MVLTCDCATSAAARHGLSRKAMLTFGRIALLGRSLVWLRVLDATQAGCVVLEFAPQLSVGVCGACEAPLEERPRCQQHSRHAQGRHACYCDLRRIRPVHRTHEPTDRESEMRPVGLRVKRKATWRRPEHTNAVLNRSQSPVADTRYFYISNKTTLSSIYMCDRRLFRIWQSLRPVATFVQSCRNLTSAFVASSQTNVWLQRIRN
jgi:hypothetical protein